MKEGREFKKLGDIATFVNGYAFKPSQWSEKGMPIIRIQNLNTPNANFNYFEGKIPQKYHVKKGDILISWSASLGAYEWEGNDAYLNQHIFKVVFDKIEVDKHYLRYAVISKLSDMEKDAHGATMRHIVKKDFDNTKIPFPSPTVQQRIVSELDLLSSIIEKKKAQLKEYDQLAQSIFYDMFGDPIENPKRWEVKKLGEVGTIVTGNTPSTKDNRNYDSNDVCFFKPSDIEKNGISLLSESEFYVSSFAYNSARKLPKGSVLVTCIGIVGKVGILEIEATCNQQINAIVPNNQVNSNYVAFSILAKRRIIESIAHAPVVPIINKGTFSQLSIPLPPLSLQQSFASKIEAIERQKNLFQQSITETETLFNSRMDYYFN